MRPKIAQVKTEPIVKTEEKSFFLRIPRLDDIKEDIPFDARSAEPLHRRVQVKDERKLSAAERIFERRRVLAEEVFENCWK